MVEIAAQPVRRVGNPQRSDDGDSSGTTLDRTKRTNRRRQQAKKQLSLICQPTELSFFMNAIVESLKGGPAPGASLVLNLLP
jgi:hypothetical protein